MCCSEYHMKQPQDSLSLVNTSYGDDGWCSCHGRDDDGNPIGYCCGYATQPDGKCDRCSEHCQDHPHHAPATAQDDPASARMRELAVDRHVEVTAVS